MLLHAHGLWEVHAVWVSGVDRWALMCLVHPCGRLWLVGHAKEHGASRLLDPVLVFIQCGPLSCFYI